jgi:hypothetical protein
VIAMGASLFRTFGSFEDAQKAHAALLRSGLPPSSVTLRSHQDEAGPVEGNFAVGNGRSPAPASLKEMMYSLLGKRDDSYDANFAQSVSRGVYTVTVEVADAAQHERACAILDQLGAVDVEDRTSHAQERSG